MYVHVYVYKSSANTEHGQVKEKEGKKEGRERERRDSKRETVRARERGESKGEGREHPRRVYIQNASVCTLKNAREAF